MQRLLLKYYREGKPGYSGGKLYLCFISKINRKRPSSESRKRSLSFSLYLDCPLKSFDD
jgi:hypothetical protein